MPYKFISVNAGEVDQPSFIQSSGPVTNLLLLAADAGRDIYTIKAILHFIDAPPMLNDVPRVCQGLIYVLDAMDTPPVLSISNFDPESWRSECLWIIANRHNPEFTSKLGAQFFLGDQRPQHNPVIHRGVQTYAFPYATIWHEPADSASEQDYYRLVAQLLTVYLTRADRLSLRKQGYRAYLKLRVLCSRRILAIPADLHIWSSSAMFLHGCRHFDANRSIELHAEYFPPIALLGRYYGGEDPSERHGGGGYRRRGVSKGAGQGVLISQGETEFPLEDPDDPDLLPGYISFVAPEPVGDDFDEVLPPGEITAQSQIWLISPGDEARPFVVELLSHQGMLAHIARGRQFLPFGYGLLTLSELANLLSGVTDEFLVCRGRLRTAPQHEQQAVRLRLEALLVLHLMLWFGRPLEDCKKLRVSERGLRPATVLELIPADGAGLAEFVFFAPTPDYSAEELLPRDAVRVSQNTISVPDLVGASALVMSLYEGLPETGGAVFSCQVKALEREVRVVLSELGGGDPRYTTHKIRSYLLRQIIADSHDVVAATMLSGVPCLSANTPLYYSQYDVNYLRSLYCRSVHRVVEGVYACAGLEVPILDVPAVAVAAVGARNCLRLDTVRANLEALLLVLRKRPSKDLRERIHWHNCLTLWTVLMFMMATGCRAIRNPLKQTEEFESRWGHGALGDKGADDGHMSRLVALPDLLRRQLQSYEAHCGAILALLESHLPVQPIPTCGFFLRLVDDEHIIYEEIRPRHISAVMREVAGFTPHPVNAYRKLIRTELAERGCPPETLAAFMGHWLQGEEPQDCFSSFCPGTYVQNLHAYLLPLMRELGWMVRNSHFVLEADA